MQRVFLTIILAFIMVSCNPSENKVNNAASDVVDADEDAEEANENLQQANADFVTEQDAFKKQNIQLKVYILVFIFILGKCARTCYQYNEQK